MELQEDRNIIDAIGRPVFFHTQTKPASHVAFKAVAHQVPAFTHRPLSDCLSPATSFPFSFPGPVSVSCDCSLNGRVAPGKA